MDNKSQNKMTSEQRKEYNKKYYEVNKETIKAKLFTKVQCKLCDKKINHQNIKKHTESNYCKSRASKSEHDNMIDILNNRILALEKLSEKIN